MNIHIRDAASPAAMAAVIGVGFTPTRPLRAQIEDQIEALIFLLDSIDPDADLEPSFGDVAPGFEDECEPDLDGEPSLAAAETVQADAGPLYPLWGLERDRSTSQAVQRDPVRQAWLDDLEPDDEPEEDDPAEPSLGWPSWNLILNAPLEREGWEFGSVTRWGVLDGTQLYQYLGASDDREDEHDGREPSLCGLTVGQGVDDDREGGDDGREPEVGF